ncbi:MAG TPA: Gfo/Idh/MocA family oxidoreductase, partial [Candidatus Nanoarchaeia archaeon]|nr:Gfo/Idh/MocA family oxidoreductase [Candidatus Nanoarchaeia archaeon]
MLNMGIIGLGYMGTQHLRILNKIQQDGLFEGFKVTAAADPDTQRLHTISNEFDLKLSSNPDEIIQSSGIDALIIASPPLYHFEQAAKALNLGKPV